MTSPTETVQSLYAAFGAGDMARLLGLVSDDVRWTFHGSLPGVPYLGTAVGKEALQRWFGQVAQEDDIQAFEPREFLAGGEHVTVLGWERTKVRATGGVFECDWVHVWTVRDGRVVRFEGFFDTAAVAAARRA